MAMLCLNFWANAQVVDVTTKGLQIGQQVPDVTLTNLHNYKDASGKPAKTAKLSDFKGKLLILDFWATWCSPCVAMIPKVESLQKQFENRLKFLSVSYQAEDIVIPFLEKIQAEHKEPFSIPQIVESKILHRYFPHIYLPHYVWINGEGIVVAITDHLAVNANDIETVLSSGKINVITKADLKLSYQESLSFLEQNHKYYHHSLKSNTTLTGYIPGLGGGYKIHSLDSLKTYRIVAQNQSLAGLFQLAYRDYNIHNFNRIIIKVNDSSKLTPTSKDKDINDWMKTKSYCFEMRVSNKLASNQKALYTLMRQQLASLFSEYKTSIVYKNVDSYALIRTSKLDKLKSKNNTSFFKPSAIGYSISNYPLQSFIKMLSLTHLQHLDTPIVDQTNYNGRIDLEINAKMDNIESINTALENYDLKFVSKKTKVAYLLIQDNETK